MGTRKIETQNAVISLNDGVLRILIDLTDLNPAQRIAVQDGLSECVEIYISNQKKNRDENAAE